MSKKLRELQARKAQAAQAKAESLRAASAILDKADAESRDLSDTEHAAFVGHKDAADAKSADIERLQAAIDIEQALLVAQAQAASFATLPGNGSDLVVTDRVAEDPRLGFSSLGDFACAVARSAHGPRDARFAAAPSTFGNESAGADGGFLIPPQFSADLWRLSLGEESLIPLTQNTEVSGNSMIFPKDETTPWGGTGIQAYWQSEAAAATQSKPSLGSETLVLHKMMVLVPVTNELLDDSAAIGSYLNAVAPECITYKANEAILFGDGAGKPLGALSGPSVVVQAKDTGQATGTLSAANISNMVTRLLVGQLANAIWIGTPDILTPLEGLTVGNYPIFLPNQTAANAPYGLLKGRPLMLSEHAAPFSSQGDLNLLSLKGYRTITKAGGVQTATSMHLFFDADATAFRFTFRMNGKPILSKPVTPPKSGNTRSYFVTLGAR